MESKLKVIILIQARMNSRRLPGKVLKKINGRTLINILTERLNKLDCFDKMILAIPEGTDDDILFKHCLDLGLIVHRGDELNVLKRFYEIAKVYNPDVVVRITGDCPLIDPIIVKEAISIFRDGFWSRKNYRTIF